MNDTTNIQTQSTELPDAYHPAVPSAIVERDPEAARLRAENIELRNAIRIRDAGEQIGRLLAAADARSPGLLFESVQDDLQFSAEGELQNAAALVDRLKKRFPEQFGREFSVGSIDAAAGAASRLPLLSAETLAHMTPAQIQKLDWAEIRRVLSNE